MVWFYRIFKHFYSLQGQGLNLKYLMSITVHHFNANDRGGAAIGAMRIFDSVLSQGLDAHFFFNVFQQQRPEYSHFVDHDIATIPQKIHRRIKAKIHHKQIEKQAAGKRNRYEKFSTTWQPIKTPYPEKYRWPDIIHLHWVSEMIDHISFFKDIPKSIPIVWTLHDINPFTGGCHYTWGCDKYQTHCHTCPQINFPSANDLSYRGFEEKLNVLEGRRLLVAANSNWSANLASKSKLFGNAFDIQTIHYPIDTEIYRPDSKEASKKQLNLPPDKIIIGFGAEYLTNYRKGFDLLLEALRILYADRKNIHALVFGNLRAEFDRSGLPEFTVTGFIEPGPEQAVVYNAVDLFVIASREEAFGQTSLEAHACATPVAGYNVGGVSDIVQDGLTGMLATEVTAGALAAQFKALIDSGKLQEFGNNGRRFVEQNFTMNSQGQKFKALYEKALS